MNATVQPGQRIEAADLITWVTTTTGRIENLLPVLAILAVGYAVIRTYMKSNHALVPTVVALLVGGAVLWGIMNVTWFSSSVGGVFTNGGAPAPHSVVQLARGRSA